MRYAWIACIAAIITLVPACAAPQPEPYWVQGWAVIPITHRVELTSVERPADSAARYGESVVEPVAGATGKYLFEDELFSIGWRYAGDRFQFEMSNHGGSSMKVVWDEAAYVGPDGISTKVIHTGTKYSQMNGSQPPSVVAKGSTLADMIVPVSAIEYDDGWEHHSLLPLGDGHAFTFRETSTDEAGVQASLEMRAAEETDTLAVIMQEGLERPHRMTILLPIEIDGTVNEYTFSFSSVHMTLGEAQVTAPARFF